MSTNGSGKLAALVTDLDGTLVDHEDASHAGMRELLSKVPAGAKLVYATGRSYKLYEDLKQSVDGLGDPDALICSVGTAVHTRTQGGSLEEDQDWRNHLHQGWNRAKALEVANSVGGLTAQEESEQGEFKLSYRGGFDAVQELRQGLQDAGIEAKVIFSSGRDVDILPERAGKGNAVRHLLSRWATLEGTTVDDFSSRTLVCGDSGNDVAMLGQPGVKACIVGNAQSELVEWYKANCSEQAAVHATGRCAWSILSALRHFRFLDSE